MCIFSMRYLPIKLFMNVDKYFMCNYYDLCMNIDFVQTVIDIQTVTVTIDQILDKPM